MTWPEAIAWSALFISIAVIFVTLVYFGLRD